MWRNWFTRTTQNRLEKSLWVRVPPCPLFMTKHNLPLKEYKWTPELAYIVGLITTDGCLSSDGRHLTFTSCDK